MQDTLKEKDFDILKKDNTGIDLLFDKQPEEIVDGLLKITNGNVSEALWKINDFFRDNLNLGEEGLKKLQIVKEQLEKNNIGNIFENCVSQISFSYLLSKNDLLLEKNVVSKDKPTDAKRKQVLAFVLSGIHPVVAMSKGIMFKNPNTGQFFEIGKINTDGINQSYDLPEPNDNRSVIIKPILGKVKREDKTYKNEKGDEYTIPVGELREILAYDGNARIVAKVLSKTEHDLTMEQALSKIKAKHHKEKEAFDNWYEQNEKREGLNRFDYSTNLEIYRLCTSYKMMVQSAIEELENKNAIKYNTKQYKEEDLGEASKLSDRVLATKNRDVLEDYLKELEIDTEFINAPFVERAKKTADPRDQEPDKYWRIEGIDKLLPGQTPKDIKFVHLKRYEDGITGTARNGTMTVENLKKILNTEENQILKDTPDLNVLYMRNKSDSRGLNSGAGWKEREIRREDVAEILRVMSEKPEWGNKHLLFHFENHPHGKIPLLIKDALRAYSKEHDKDLRWSFKGDLRTAKNGVSYRIKVPTKDSKVRQNFEPHPYYQMI